MEENKTSFNPAMLNQMAAENTDEIKFSMVDIVNMMMGFWWLIALMAILIGGATYAYSRITSVAEYESAGTLYIDTQTEQITSDVNVSSIVGARTLLPTYIEVLKSTVFLEDVSRDIESKYSASALYKMVQYEAVEETNLINLTVKADDPHDAYLIARSIMKNAPSKISRVFEGGSVKIIEYPKEATSPVSGSDFKRAIIGFIAGVALGVFIVFLINLFDTSIKNAEELTKKYGIPILGEIPNLIDV